MWPFKKKKSSFEVDSRLVAMAKVYVDCSSIEEFLVQLDLKMLKKVSWSNWTNPFVIHHLLKNKVVSIVLHAILPINCVICGGVMWAISDEHKALQLILLAVQLSIVCFQFWIANKDMDARRAVSEVEIDRLVASISK